MAEWKALKPRIGAVIFLELYAQGRGLHPALPCHCLGHARPSGRNRARLALYSGHSLRAGLASSAEVDERYVQKQLGHASAEMTRRYQRRRERFRVNLTKAAGL